MFGRRVDRNVGRGTEGGGGDGIIWRDCQWEDNQIRKYFNFISSSSSFVCTVGIGFLLFLPFRTN